MYWNKQLNRNYIGIGVVSKKIEIKNLNYFKLLHLLNVSKMYHKLVGNARSRARAYYTWFLIRNHYTWYREKSIERPKGIHFFSTHNFWTASHNTTIKAYLDRKMSTFQDMRLSMFSYVWLKSCVEIKWISPGLSVEILR